MEWHFRLNSLLSDMVHTRNSNRPIARDRPDETSLRGNNLNMDTALYTRRCVMNGAPVTQKAYLEIYEIGKKCRGFEITDKEISIGRKTSCQICIPLFGVSRIHARIYFFNEEYYIEDLKSTNGTYVNTIKIVKCILRNNDQIEIGEAKIIFIEEKTRREF